MTLTKCTHICPPCKKFFNSEEQWKAHEGGKKHKYVTETVVREKSLGKKQIISNSSNTIHEDIQRLRALGISIPALVNKIIKCQKMNNQSS